MWAQRVQVGLRLSSAFLPQSLQMTGESHLGTTARVRRIYYLGPHPDDIAFSCAGRVLGDVASGAEVTLVSVFISGEFAEVRRAEDEEAARRLGCRHLSIDLFEALDRPEVHGSLGLFMPFGPAHLGITSEVVTRLGWHLHAGAELVAPLAVGAHIDHRIVHEAARALAFQLSPDVGLSYFEDLPYSLAPFAVARRLAALETTVPELPGTRRASRAVEIAAHRDYLRQLPIMRRWPVGLRGLACHLAARTIYAADSQGQRPGVRPTLVPELRTVSANHPARLAALEAYASQWPQFADSPAALLARFVEYGRTLGPALPPEKTYERTWHDHSVGRSDS
jgi:LmbE family N-acetylglucosaminyl deacetylase